MRGRSKEERRSSALKSAIGLRYRGLVCESGMAERKRRVRGSARTTGTRRRLTFGEGSVFFFFLLRRTRRRRKKRRSESLLLEEEERLGMALERMVERGSSEWNKKETGEITRGVDADFRSKYACRRSSLSLSLDLYHTRLHTLLHSHLLAPCTRLHLATIRARLHFPLLLVPSLGSRP